MSAVIATLPLVRSLRTLLRFTLGLECVQSGGDASRRGWLLFRRGLRPLARRGWCSSCKLTICHCPKFDSFLLLNLGAVRIASSA